MLFFNALFQPHLGDEATLTPAMKEYLQKRSAATAAAAAAAAAAATPEEGARPGRSNNDTSHLFSL